MSPREALRFVRLHEPDLARGLEDAARQQQLLPLYIQGYRHALTRQIVMALLFHAQALNVPVLLDPNWPAPATPPSDGHSP